MSSLAAPRCRHIKANGTQCGSPALRNKKFCFYHHEDRPLKIECYSDGLIPPEKSTCLFLKMRTPFRPSFARSCRWSCKKESNGKPPASCSTRSRSPLRISSAWNSKSRNQSRLSRFCAEDGMENSHSCRDRRRNRPRKFEREFRRKLATLASAQPEWNARPATPPPNPPRKDNDKDNNKDKENEND